MACADTASVPRNHRENTALLTGFRYDVLLSTGIARETATQFRRNSGAIVRTGCHARFRRPILGCKRHSGRVTPPSNGQNAPNHEIRPSNNVVRWSNFAEGHEEADRINTTPSFGIRYPSQWPDELRMRTMADEIRSPMARLRRYAPNDRWSGRKCDGRRIKQAPPGDLPEGASKNVLFDAGWHVQADYCASCESGSCDAGGMVG